MEQEQIKTRVVGIDVGVEFTTYAIVDIRGSIIAKESIHTTAFSDVNEFISALTEKIILLAEANGGYDKIRSVGISAPSANFMTGSIENAANMPWKGHVPLAAMLRDRLGLAVALGNDAHITAIGEKVYGSAHGMQDFIVISLGHGGVGSCIYMNGRPYLGTGGFAGEVGHICVEHNGRQCSCGNRGCLEEYASARGLVQTAHEVLAERGDGSLMSIHAELTPQIIASCCEQGDEAAIETFRRAGEMLGMALANYASVVDPEAIILTGELTRYAKWLLEPVRQSFEANVFHNLRGKVKILVSILVDSERDVLGASALAWDVKEYSLFK